MTDALTYTALGLTWKTDIAWPELPAETSHADPDAWLLLADDADVSALWSGADGGDRWLLRIDDDLLVVERGVAGDFRLTHPRGTFHVGAEAAVVSCAAADPSDAWWLRLVLDTVLWTTALLHGVEAIHASAVEGEHGVVAFAGESGAGKTTLALEFLRRGDRLFCDDVLALRRGEGGVTACSASPLLNVPAARAADPELPLTPIATLGGEVWCAADPPERTEAPLAHLFLLERGPRAPGRLRRSPPTLFELRRFCLEHGLVPNREQARFELCADLVETVPVTRLRVDAGTSPAELADRAAAALEQTGALV